MDTFINRIIRAIKLKSDLYEEVKADSTALQQAIIIVIIVGLISGINGAIITNSGITMIFIWMITALVSWFIWSYITFIIGTKVIRTPETRVGYSEFLRTLGFACSPGIISILGLISGLQAIVSLIAGVWMIVAMIIALRQALNYKSTLQAIGVCIVSSIISGIIIIIPLSIIQVETKPNDITLIQKPAPQTEVEP